MILDKIKDYKFILATKSPRRHELIRQMGIPFSVLEISVDENPPPGLNGREIACYLAEEKSKACEPFIKDDRTITLTADTVVWLENQSLGKPIDQNDAFRMLSLLSGKKHQVITGVSLSSINRRKTFYASTDVYFKDLTPGEINYYIYNFRPFDKAGAYGVQEWIGIIGIKRIEGSYYNVVGLPVQMVYEEINEFISRL